MLEKVVYNIIIDYVSKKATKHQFGFLPKKSTIQQLLVFVEKVIEQKCETDVVYMDFRKAFDSVSHKHLLMKLQSIGITGNVWKWFEAYLKPRYQCVKIGDSYSELCNVLSAREHVRTSTVRHLYQ